MDIEGEVAMTGVQKDVLLVFGVIFAAIQAGIAYLAYRHQARIEQLAPTGISSQVSASSKYARRFDLSFPRDIRQSLFKILVIYLALGFVNVIWAVGTTLTMIHLPYPEEVLSGAVYIQNIVPAFFGIILFIRYRRNLGIPIVYGAVSSIGIMSYLLLDKVNSVLYDTVPGLRQYGDFYVLHQLMWQEETFIGLATTIVVICCYTLFALELALLLLRDLLIAPLRLYINKSVDNSAPPPSDSADSAS
jgi:hypothetical protein